MTKIESHLSIQIDAGELNQILVNLVINSRDAIHGAGKVLIRSCEVDISEPLYSLDQQMIPEGKFLSIEVSDTGAGISPEHMPHLFEPFFTTKEVGKGTGLGLPMVHGIVRRANGHIIVNSTSGNGASFQLLFPIAFSKNETNNLSPSSSSPQFGNGQRIWIVDDELSILNYLYELLTTSGYHVQCFTTPSQVLDGFTANMERPDLLITDQTMPELSGIGLAKQISARWPDLPIILCSGDGIYYDPIELNSGGIVKVVSKPILSDSFLTVLANEIMKKTRSNK